MKIVIPKGAYHNYCRNAQNSKSLQHTTQMRSVRNHRFQKRIQEIQHFHDFESYLLHLDNRNSQRNTANGTRNSSTGRETKTSRPRTQQIVRESSNNQKQTEQLIKPFFPFFKCKIESCSVPNRENNFRINSRKFKLNYRIIEQNMGKGNQKFYI